MPRGRKPDSLDAKLLKASDLKITLATSTREIPECPMPLDKVGLAEWHRIAPILHREGRLSDADAPALALYCDAFARYLFARKDLMGNGVCITTETGATKANPAAAVVKEASATMTRILGSFGCNPSDRSRLGLSAVVAAPDEYAAFMRKRERSAR